MTNKIWKYSTLSISILSTMMQTTPTFASPVSVTQGQINTTKIKINNMGTEIQQLDNKVSMAMDKSQKLNDDIKVQQTKIEETKAEIEKAKQDLDAEKQVFYARLRSIDEQSQPLVITYAELLMSSQSLSEFLDRTDAISIIIQSDSDIITGLKEKQQTLIDAQKQLDNDLSVLKSKQEELAAQQKQIEADKQKVLTQLADSKHTLQQQQSQLSQQQAQAQLKIQQAHLSFADVPMLPYSSDKAKTVIATAEKYLGVPYVWGGTTPSGFDCSGLMQYVYQSIGVNLPRVSQDQQNVGTMISPTQVQPGDLVFMGVPAFHVGMYIGGGKWIEAPQTGDVVKIADYNPAIFSSASRILN
jgi:peptidoglycan DL-endopeptidase CwlO